MTASVCKLSKVKGHTSTRGKNVTVIIARLEVTGVAFFNHLISGVTLDFGKINSMGPLSNNSLLELAPHIAIRH